MTTDAMREGTVEANGIRFAYLEAGEGPLVLLLHGFPDDPRTWENQVPALLGAGYRVVAPFMRGYHPTEIPDDARYDLPTLGRDVSELIAALGDGPAYVVGHDWGALATFGAMALYPDAIRRAAVIAADHPRTTLRTFERPELLHHLFHVWFLALGDVAKGAVRGDDMALIDYLWRHWSPGGEHDSHDHVERVKRETLGPEGALEAAVSYYAPLVNFNALDPDLLSRAFEPIGVPALVIFGAQDPVHELSDGEDDNYTAPYRREVLAGARHFVHRERPEEVNRLLLDWLGADEREPVGARQAAA